MIPRHFTDSVSSRQFHEIRDRGKSPALPLPILHAWFTVWHVVLSKSCTPCLYSTRHGLQFGVLYYLIIHTLSLFYKAWFIVWCVVLSNHAHPLYSTRHGLQFGVLYYLSNHAHPLSLFYKAWFIVWCVVLSNHAHPLSILQGMVYSLVCCQGSTLTLKSWRPWGSQHIISRSPK